MDASWRISRATASGQAIAISLIGNWREEHLFALKQAMSFYDAYSERLDECDRQLETMLATLQIHKVDISQKKRRASVKNSPKFDLRTYLIGMCGVDLTRIDGIEVTTAMKVLSEGRRHETVQKCEAVCLVAWAVSRNKDIRWKSAIGGKQAHSKPCCPGTAHGSSFIEIQPVCTVGAYYRRLCGRLDKAKAITATAHKLARLIYTMLTKGTEYVDSGQDYHKERYRQRVLHHLTVRARKMGFNLTPVPEAT